MNGKKQVITIKGTRDGLTLYIDDTCSFDQIIDDLEEKLSQNLVDDDQPMISVNLQVGNRYLNQEQKEQLKEMIQNKQKLVINQIQSDVITKEEALQWKQDSEITPVYKIVRSGQVVDVTGDLLLLGDVNPGGKIVATGNIYVMGHLRGTAHAGINGNREAVIAASYMKPSQLRIADFISRSPDYDTEGVYMECAFVDEEKAKIIIDRLHLLSQKKQAQLNWLERRMLNG